jgi:hypothetical protein
MIKDRINQLKVKKKDKISFLKTTYQTKEGFFDKKTGDKLLTINLKDYLKKRNE